MKCKDSQSASELAEDFKTLVVGGLKIGTNFWSIIKPFGNDPQFPSVWPDY